MDVLKRFKRAVDEHLSLRSKPIAIKLLEQREDVPANFIRPLRELGEPIRPCLAWHLVRHKGLSVAMLEEDFSSSCPAAIFIFGILEPLPEWIEEGGIAYEIYAGSIKAAANMERSLFLLGVGEYKGMALAPLEKASFTPDLVMMYINSRDALRLGTAAAWRSGDPLKVTMAARCLCSDGVVQPFRIRQPVVAIPCGGDREHAGTQDDEIVFTTPIDRLEGIMEGLEGFERSHTWESLEAESLLRRRYNEMAKIIDKKLGRSGS